MKKLRFLALVFSLALIILCMPAETYAEDNDYEGYGDSDYEEYEEYDYLYDTTGLHSDTGRTYDGKFQTLADDGTMINCLAYGDNEAVVYLADAGYMDEIVIPETIYDAVTERNRTIVGVIAQAENMVKDEYTLTEDFYKKYPFSFGNMSSKNITLKLPSTLKFIGQGAFIGCNALKEVVINSDDDYCIEGRAFGECTGLENVDFAGSGTACIEKYVFIDCTGLKQITFPADSEVEDTALAGCYNVETVINAPEKLDFCSDNLESNCPKDKEGHYVIGLKKVTFREGGTDIMPIEVNSWWFDDIRAPYLKDVTLPSTAKYIGGLGGTAIESIDLPAGLEEIEGSCFKDCSKLRQINLSDSIRIIGAYAFAGCENLTGNATLLNLEEVGNNAFAGCHDLKLSVKINGMIYGPEFYDSGVTDITFTATDDVNDWVCFYNNEFTDCPDLRSITVLGDHTYFKSVDGILYASFPDREAGGTGRVWALLKYPPAKSGGDYTIPSDVTYIAAYAFEGCKFNSIHIPVTVKGFRNNNQFMDDNNKVIGYPFSTMASNATVYYVKNSYVDKEYAADYYEMLEHISFKSYGNLKTEAGPRISISYDLAGGENAAGNPTSMIAGESVTLSDPRREGYEFDGWEHLYTYGEDFDTEWWAVDSNGILTPVNDELVNGVKLRAKWVEPGSEEPAPATPAVPSGPAVGKVVSVGGSSVTVTKAAAGTAAGTVAYTKAPNKKSVTVPASVVIEGKTFNVTQVNASAFKGAKIRTVTIGPNVTSIKKNAFKGSKATKLVVKSKLLKKASVKGSLKGSKVKTVQVKVGTKKVNKTFVKKYKKIFTKANAGKKVTVK